MWISEQFLSHLFPSASASSSSLKIGGSEGHRRQSRPSLLHDEWQEPCDEANSTSETLGVMESYLICHI